MHSLERHGIGARALSVRARDAAVGEVILAEATALECDLLIKGAYTQSRLRQMIFGGMTRHLILSSTLPVLFSY